MRSSILLAFVACVFGAANAGPVDFVSCGGSGTLARLLVHGCTGSLCTMYPGNAYPCEAHMVPALASPQLSLKVTALYFGFEIVLFDVVLPNSSVTPGQLYVISFVITPTDVLLGLILPVTAEIRGTASSLVEVCATFEVSIEELPVPTTAAPTNAPTNATTAAPIDASTAEI